MVTPNQSGKSTLRIIQVDYGLPGQRAEIHIAHRKQELVEARVKHIDPGLSDLDKYPKEPWSIDRDSPNLRMGRIRQVVNINFINPEDEASEEIIDGTVKLHISWTEDDFDAAGGEPWPWYFDKKAGNWKPFLLQYVTSDSTQSTKTGTFIIQVTNYGDPTVGVDGKR